MTAEEARLLVVFLIALLALVGTSMALVGLRARRNPGGALPLWSYAWAALFLGGSIVLADPRELHPVAAALLGMPPFLLLAGSLAFTGRSPSPWVIALIPAGALLGVLALAPSAALPWAGVVLAVEGSAAVVLLRGSRGGRRLPERLLPFATALFALAHAAAILSYADRGLSRPLTLGAIAIGALVSLQILAILDRIREASEQTARARRESDSRFQSLADLSNLVVLILDTDHRVVEWNRGAEAIYGWTREEALGREYLGTFLPEEVRAPIAEEIARVLAGSQTHGYENPVLTREGERILRWNVTRLVDDAGEPSGILCLAEDVTEERRQEVEQRRLFTAVEQAGDAVVIADQRGIVVYANPAFSAMMERDPADVVGHPIRKVVHGWEDEKLVSEILDHWRRREIWRGRYTTRWPDGRTFVRDATFGPVRDESGEAAYGVAVLHDVTREQELEQELVRSQKLTALGTLAGGIAHDFNNLLTAVIGGAHLLLETQTPQETRQTAQEILEAAERGASLSRQLLAFSRRQPLHPQVIDVDGVVREMTGLLERLIGEHIELTTQSEEDLWPVLAERSQVEQVIMNLVLNARDAMSSGGRLTLRTANRRFEQHDDDRPSALEPGDYVSLSVDDTGIGMDAETRSRAFEPFFTRKPLGAGTGLGLATVFGIVRQSGGDVTLRSEPGRGSQVTVHLPRAQGSVDDLSTHALPVELGGKETILLVEDDRMVRRTARHTLEDLGYRVLEAEDAEAARSLLANAAAIDLLVTDVVMPGVSGPELAQQLLGTHPDLRVLFISGYEGRLAEPPPGPLLEKPFTPDQLALKVHELLRG